ncbi:MAG: DNA primase [Thermoanaerobaculia bacterium]
MALRNIQLTPELVQAVRDVVDIVDIAGDYTKLRKAGKRHGGLCPLHKEKTPSFSVEPAQGLFYCFGCGQGGDAIRLHMLLTGDDFPAAIEALARRYGVPLPKLRRGAGTSGPDLEPALEAAAEYFTDQLQRQAKPRSYLEERRIPAELIEEFGLGYAPPGWQNLLEALGARIPRAELEAAGLVGRSRKSGKPYDRFRDRLVFPIRSASGRLLGFGGRALDDDPAKYVNTGETAGFHKGRLLYGLDRARRPIREAGRLLLVEGYFDVLGAVASGVDWTVASMGTALTPEQARLASRYAEEVVVGYDGDKAGEEAARRVLPELLRQGLGVRRARFGAGHDPDSLRLEEGPEAVAEAVEEARDAVSAEVDRLSPPELVSDPRRVAKAAAAIGELLQVIPDAVLRFGYGRRAAARLQVPEELLWRRAAAPQSTDATPAREPGVVRSLEERALQLLLSGSAPPPPADRLPPPEVFRDDAMRNIFGVFCTLYRDGSGDRPDPQLIVAELGADDGAVDRLARLLLEGPFASPSGELGEAFKQLKRRWQQQRLRALASEIGEAQQAGDEARLKRLLSKKTALSRELHPRLDDGD